MGSNMARNIVDAGYSVTGIDVVQAAIKVAAEHGVTPA
ncbi:MAG: NAD(P)-binding domain-containing protein, partial [Yaniella sp.]|nr:NAD(P)-binding domain-containing protein [Yaniella sp.]